MEKWKLKWIWYPFSDRLVCYRFKTVESVAYGEDCIFKMWRGKPRLAVALDQIKLNVSAVSNVSVSVEKWLLTGYLLKLAAKCAILWNQKLRCGTHSSFLSLAKWTCFDWAFGKSSPISLLAMTCWIFLNFF